jgi:hypothetical protein
MKASCFGSEALLCGFPAQLVVEEHAGGNVMDTPEVHARLPYAGAAVGPEPAATRS